MNGGSVKETAWINDEKKKGRGIRRSPYGCGYLYHHPLGLIIIATPPPLPHTHTPFRT